MSFDISQTKTGPTKTTKVEFVEGDSRIRANIENGSLTIIKPDGSSTTIVVENGRHSVIRSLA